MTAARRANITFAALQLCDRALDLDRQKLSRMSHHTVETPRVAPRLARGQSLFARPGNKHRLGPFPALLLVLNDLRLPPLYASQCPTSSITNNAAQNETGPRSKLAHIFQLDFARNPRSKQIRQEMKKNSQNGNTRRNFPTPGAPFLARGVREKWRFRSQRIFNFGKHKRFVILIRGRRAQRGEASEESASRQLIDAGSLSPSRTSVIFTVGN